MLYPQYRKWRTCEKREGDGILIAADITQEWLLPWWWNNYQKQNSHRVAFVDFGMSQEKKEWCRDRGALIPLLVADIFVAEREEIAPELILDWEANFGKQFWSCRNAWFKKPLACLQSPFERTIWIDLDCEVRGSILPLFTFSQHASGMALCKDPLVKQSPYPIYNSGVIVFERGLPLIEEWAHMGFEKNHEFRGDQELLSYLLAGKKVGELPQEYNWSRCDGENPDALIYHLHGEHGRSVIRHQMTSNIEKN
jgi:hypothetical protein